jgi:hypothetical protein
MGIEDIQISEELETNAPSIKYRGNEGPKSPQEEQEMAMKMAMAMEAEQAKVSEMAMAEENRMAEEDYSSSAYRNKLIGQLMDSGGLDYGSAVKEADRIIEIKLRPKAAFGGIMGRDGRRQYGIGSFLKKTVRKLIPNEIADIAVKAAPFVAPFNPLAAGLMSGIGGFDQTGKIGSSLKSGLMNYGLGNVSRMVGGAGFQGGLKAPGTGTGFGSYFTSPTSGNQLFGNAAKKIVPNTNITSNNLTGLLDEGQAGSNLTANALDEFKNIPNKINIADPKSSGNFITRGLDKLNLSKIKEYIPTSFADLKDPKKAFGAIGLASLAGGLMTAAGGEEETVDAIMDRGEGLDILDIRTRVSEAFKDPSGKKLAALRVEFPYLGTQASKNTAIMADGGRIGYMNGGYTTGGTGFNQPGYLGGMATRMPMEEGGIMDLGGMEKDYRAEGGFVPIGKKEKADDVPARLSVNEFVFTADAVRNAGGGDIDKGAEVMENLMKNLEQGGQVSEESQGMQGAREMFQTSQNLEGVM